MIRHRYRRITLFFGRILLGFVVWDLIFPKIGLRKWARRTRPDRLKRSAIAFRNLAVEMGGVLIKVGQFLSSRVDILPQEFTDELAGLQDEVPPEDYAKIRSVAEAEFGKPLREKYFRFEDKPLAAASLGQVHRAQIKVRSNVTGELETVNVVVKVQRPDIEKIINTDMAALRTVGDWLRRYRPINRRVDVRVLLGEFDRILHEEIDYLAEGRNAETFSTNFSGDASVRVPYVVWTHTTKRVLTLENVWAIKITDYESLEKAGIDRAEVASKLFDVYLKQIFDDRFFHADPHPGNLFILPLGKTVVDGRRRNWKLTFVDFGMVGRIPEDTRDGLRELVIAVGTKDTARMVKAYQMLGVLLPDANLELIAKAEERAFERFWGKSMRELRDISTEEMREFTSEFRELIYTMPFQIPQDFIFLGRAVGILGGMCTGLDPEFNVWQHISPYAEKVIAEEATAGAEIWIEEAKTFLGALLSLPLKMESTLNKIDRGEIAIKAPEIEQQVSGINRAIRQVVVGIVFAALLLGGIQLRIATDALLGDILLVGAGLSLVWLVIQGTKK
jgi:predicted unusual protein kinase regulating ubiquinone biosynthesis (AarF/ABC1/UbiB family)